MACSGVGCIAFPYPEAGAPTTRRILENLGHISPSSNGREDRPEDGLILSLGTDYLGSVMNKVCPSCLSERVITLNRARRAGGAVGLVGGSVGAAASVLSGARTGMAIGAIAGPPGSVLGGIVGALVAASVGGATGAIAGAQLGEVIDERILDNCRCLACGHTFSAASAEFFYRDDL